jgi:hypothetical protein
MEIMLQYTNNRICTTLSSLILFVSTALGGGLELYPFEPVIVSIPHQASHLKLDYSTNVVITCQNTIRFTNQICRGNLFAVTNGYSMFMLFDVKTNVFALPGLYEVSLEGTLTTVNVLVPSVADSNVVPFLETTTIRQIILNRGKEELDDDLKAKCQQIMTVSPLGRYSAYATVYLSIDGLYSSLRAIVEDSVEPDLAKIGSEIVALPVPETNLRWTVLYNKGYAFGMRQEKQNAIDSFTTLTNGVQHSIWSENAAVLLQELKEQNP